MRRFLLKLVCGLVPVTIAACYGAMMDYGTLEGQVIDRETRQPIPGVNVSCKGADGYESGGAISGTDGNFVAYLADECSTAEFTDIDGDANGGQYEGITAPYAYTMKVALTRR